MHNNKNEQYIQLRRVTMKNWYNLQQMMKCSTTTPIHNGYNNNAHGTIETKTILLQLTNIKLLKITRIQCTIHQMDQMDYNYNAWWHQYQWTINTTNENRLQCMLWSFIVINCLQWSHSVYNDYIVKMTTILKSICTPDIVLITTLMNIVDFEI